MKAYDYWVLDTRAILMEADETGAEAPAACLERYLDRAGAQGYRMVHADGRFWVLMREREAD